MRDLLSNIKTFLESDGWPVDQSTERPVLYSRFSGDDGNWRVVFQERPKEEQVVIYSVSPVNCPEEKRPLMAEFITRANYGMIIGNFEMDYNDGEVRYKTSLDIEGGELSETMVKSLTYANVLMMDKYFNGIMAVIYGGKLPKQAIDEIESPENAD